MNYPTHTFIRNKVLCGLMQQFTEEIGCERYGKILLSESQVSAGFEDGNQLIRELVSKHQLDIDEIIYDHISEFDPILLRSP